jgi:hypothetical protein
VKIQPHAASVGDGEVVVGRLLGGGVLGLGAVILVATADFFA